MIVARTLLWFYSGSSDKVYRAEVKENGNGTFTLTAFWGRRGKMLQSQEKGCFSTQWAAMRVFHDLLASKRAKGYKEVESVPA